MQSMGEEMTTNRERFNKVIHHKKPDKLPWIELFPEEVLVNWIQEGLDLKQILSVEWQVTDILVNYPVVKGFNPYNIFECQDLMGNIIPIDLAPLPRYKQQKISETKDYEDILTGTGALARRKKTNRYAWYSMPMYIDFPVKDMKSWQDYKKRLNPEDLRRYPKDWSKDVYTDYYTNSTKSHTTLPITGFYGFGAEIMGILGFPPAFYKMPELIIDMVEYWAYFTIETIRDAVVSLKNQIDLIYWWEDMANRHGPCISPKLFKEFLLPHYKKVTSFLQKNKINRIMLDSDGNIKPLIDLFIESGISGLWPMEVNAGMDAVEIKKKYGKKLFLMGNLDKREIAKGGQSMKNEVDSKLPVLKTLGGYIPGADHLIPIECSYNTFLEYSNYIKNIISY